MEEEEPSLEGAIQAAIEAIQRRADESSGITTPALLEILGLPPFQILEVPEMPVDPADQLMIIEETRELLRLARANRTTQAAVKYPEDGGFSHSYAVFEFPMKYSRADVRKRLRRAFKAIFCDPEKRDGAFQYSKAKIRLDYLCSALLNVYGFEMAEQDPALKVFIKAVSTMNTSWELLYDLCVENKHIIGTFKIG